MRIINQTRNTLLADSALLANTFPKRIQGLLGKRKLDSGQALILKPCNSIHTFFMRFPIDVLFVDKNNRVIKSIPNLKPFRITLAYFSSLYVIEMPTGAITASSTITGDTISIQL